MGSIRNRKTARKFTQNRKTAINFNQNRKPHSKPSKPKICTPQFSIGKTENNNRYQIRKTACILAENRKPNAKKRKNRKPQHTPKPKNRSFSVQKPKNRSQKWPKPQNRKSQRPPPERGFFGETPKRVEKLRSGSCKPCCFYMTFSTFLSDSNFKFVKPLSRASNQQNKHKTPTFNIFFLFCGIFISF